MDIPQAHAWVLMSLADHAHHDGTKVYPGNKLTAWKTGYSVTYIKRLLKDLRDEYGLIALVKEGGGKEAAEYRICVENFAAHEKNPLPARGAARGNHNAAKQTGEPELPGNSQNKGGNWGNKGGNSTRARGETSLETSLETSPEGASAAKKPKSQNDHTGKLIDDLEELGYFLDKDQVTQISGNFGALKRKGATHEMLVRTRQRMVSEWPRIQLSPQRAYADLKGEQKVVPLKRAPCRAQHEEQALANFRDIEAAAGGKA